MRARRQKRVSRLDEDSNSDQNAKPAKISKNAHNSQVNKRNLVIVKEKEEEQPSRPIRQRKMTKKLEESYGVNSLMEKKSPIKRTKRQSRPQTSTENISPSKIAIKTELLKDAEEIEENDYLYQQYLSREEIFDSPKIRVKEEPLSDQDDIHADNESESGNPLPIPIKCVKLPISNKSPLKIEPHIREAPKKLKKSLKRRNRVKIRAGSIFDDYRLRSPRNIASKLLPKPEMPKDAGKVVGPDEVKSVLGALVKSQEINFRRPKLEKSFNVVQASVLKYTPGFLPIFIDIMKETQTSMKNRGYFDCKKPIRSGEDRLLEMLTDLKNLRLNIAKKNIKQEPE